MLIPQCYGRNCRNKLFLSLGVIQEGQHNFQLPSVHVYLFYKAFWDWSIVWWQKGTLLYCRHLFKTLVKREWSINFQVVICCCSWNGQLWTLCHYDFEHQFHDLFPFSFNEWICSGFRSLGIIILTDLHPHVGLAFPSFYCSLPNFVFVRHLFIKSILLSCWANKPTVVEKRWAEIKTQMVRCELKLASLWCS